MSRANLITRTTAARGPPWRLRLCRRQRRADTPSTRQLRDLRGEPQRTVPCRAVPRRTLNVLTGLPHPPDGTGSKTRPTKAANRPTDSHQPAQTYSSTLTGRTLRVDCSSLTWHAAGLGLGLASHVGVIQSPRTLFQWTAPPWTVPLRTSPYTVGLGSELEVKVEGKCSRGLCHRGRHAKIFGWAVSAAYDRRYTNEHTLQANYWCGQMHCSPPNQNLTYNILLKQFPK